MKIIKTRSKDLLIIEPIVHYDDRGYFFESYKNNLINHISFVQDNESKSSKNTIRGLHFQNPPYEQTKLVRCVSGKVLDIAVDLRSDSETYGEHFKLVLSGLNKKQFLIPRGFAHGYLVLSREAIVSYKVDNYYSPSHDNGIKWDDENLNINWGVNKLDIIVSEKDNNLPPLTKIFNPF
tara:strand:+ start:26082 stop:26618 length:537 start_codon:yes stop_codon:yes gene_type:complete